MAVLGNFVLGASAPGEVDQAATVSLPTPTVVVDNFDDNSLSAGWSNWGGGNVAESSGRINITTSTSAGAYFGIDRTTAVDINEAYVSTRLVSAGNQSLTGYGAYPLLLGFSTNNSAYWIIIAGQADCYTNVGNVFVNRATMPYLAGTHVYFAIGESGGELQWLWSTDGTSWTVAFSMASPFGSDTTVTPTIMAGTASANGSTTTLQVDDLRTHGIAVGTTHSADAALAVTATLGATAVGQRPAAAALAVTAGLTAAGTPARPAAAALAATATLSTGAARTATAGAALAATANLTAAPNAPTALAGAALAVTATLSAAATRWASVATSTVALTEDTTATLANPERGFFQYTETHYDVAGAGYVALSSATLASARASAGQSVVFRYFVMEKYLSVDTLDTAWLNLVAADFDAIRTAGCKAVVRFAYSTSGDMVAPYGDAPTIGRLAGHIRQLRATLNAAADVILAVEAGFIGMWGEWYYTDSYGDQGALTEAQWVDRKTVLAELLATDARIPVLVRYPGIKHRLLVGDNTVAGLSDTFATADTTKWNGFGASVTVAGGQLQITPTVSGSYQAVGANATVNLTGHAVQVEVPQTLNLGNGSTETLLEFMAPDFSNRFVMGRSGSSLIFRVSTGGAASDTTTTYNAVSHRWWRIRESTGTVVFETSPDASTWTTRRTAAHTLTTTSGGYVRLEAGFYGTEPAPGTAVFDNLSTYFVPPADTATRVGFHNDGFLGTFEDLGTYTTFTALSAADTRTYTAAETSRPLPMGGESAESNPPTSDWANAAVELATYHWTFLNPSYHATVLASWGANIDIAKRKLGYRLVGSQVKTQAAVVPGATLRFELSVTNAGYAAPLTPRDVVVVLDNQAGSRYETTLPVDVRNWTPGVTQLLIADVPVPGGAPAGSYHVALWLPDQTPGLRSTPEYAIRLANVGTWNATHGYNDLATVTIGATEAAAALAVTASLSAGAAATRPVAATLAATATLTTAAARSAPAGAALAATATLSTAATATRPTAAALAVTAGLTTAATRTAPAGATLAATATLAAAATTTSSSGADAALAVTATLTTAATGVIQPGAALTATATLTAAAAGTRPAAAAMAVTASLQAGATRTALPGASLVATASLTAGAGRTAVAGAALPVTATLAAEAAVGAAPVLAAAALAVTATLTAGGTRTAGGAAALAVTATLSVGALRAARAAADLAVTATLTAGGTRMQAAGAALAVLATLTAAAIAEGGITYRPFAGTTGRPGPGITVRPFAGTTVR